MIYSKPAEWRWLASDRQTPDTILMHTIISLTNHFLIAMPQLADPNFSHTLTLICEHSEEGALGVVVNRPLDLHLADLLEHLSLETHDPKLANQLLHTGGPVQTDRGFVLHRPIGAWESTIMLSDSLGLTASRDIIQAIASGEAGPMNAMVLLGYAGWEAGQLEQELADNAWLTLPAEEGILFDIPTEDRWQAAASHLGIDLNLLSTDAGHA